MERKLSPAPLPAKLAETVATDYPGLEIRVSFPEEWQLIDRLQRADTPLYVAGFPPSQERGRSNKFLGLSAEINQSLTSYRLYKLFEPFVTPLYQVAWDVQQGHGQIIGEGGAQLHLQPIGQAQMWKGKDYGLLWEGYFFETRRGGINWLDELALFWQAVERDMKVNTIFSRVRGDTSPCPSPLRTGCDSFPSSGSSLLQPLNLTHLMQMLMADFM